MYTLVKMHSDDGARVETTEITRGNENVLHICTYIYTHMYILLYIRTNEFVTDNRVETTEITRENENVLRICTYMYTYKYILLYIHTIKIVLTTKKGSELRKVLEKVKICKN